MQSHPWPFWLKRFACVDVVSRPTGLAKVSAAQGMRGLLAAGRFLQLESGWTTTELLALLAGGSFVTRGSTLQSCCTGGIERSSQIDVLVEATIELERVQAFLECRLESMEGWAPQLWNSGHGLLGLFDEQCSRSLENISSCAKRTLFQLNACMAVFGGSLVDEPPVFDLPRVVLPFLDDDIEPPAVTRHEPAPVIEYMTPAGKEYVSPAVTNTAPSPVTECVASTPAGIFDKLFPVDELAPFARVQQQTVDVPMPQILRVTAEVDEFAPFKRLQQQTVEVPMPRILKEAVEADKLAPFQRVQQHTVDVSLPEILKEAVEVDDLAPFEHVQQQTVDVTMPQILKGTVEVGELVPVERVQQQTIEMPMPQISKKTVEIVELAPCERVQQRVVEMPMSQILKETVDVDLLVPFERIQQQPMAQILKGTVEVGELVPYERVQQQIVGMPMPQILKETVEVTESVSPASAVTDTVPGPVTKNVAPTRAVTFDETAPMIKCVAPSPAASNREEEIIDMARCLDDLKMQRAEMGMQHPRTDGQRRDASKVLDRVRGRYTNTGRRSAASAATADWARFHHELKRLGENPASHTLFEYLVEATHIAVREKTENTEQPPF